MKAKELLEILRNNPDKEIVLTRYFNTVKGIEEANAYTVLRFAEVTDRHIKLSQVHPRYVEEVDELDDKPILENMDKVLDGVTSFDYIPDVGPEDIVNNKKEN
jgi:hypothetical protein